LSHSTGAVDGLILLPNEPTRASMSCVVASTTPTRLRRKLPG
jgi:hypothetical protein